MTGVEAHIETIRRVNDLLRSLGNKRAADHADKALAAVAVRCAQLEAALPFLTDEIERRKRWELNDGSRGFCRGGTESCESCVGSCGIEEYEAALAAVSSETKATP